MHMVILVHGIVLHVTGVGIGFQNEIFVIRMNIESTVKSIRKIWIDVYAGLPSNRNKYR